LNGGGPNFFNQRDDGLLSHGVEKWIEVKGDGAKVLWGGKRKGKWAYDRKGKREEYMKRWKREEGENHYG
jgi:hypothetical protein